MRVVHLVDTPLSAAPLRLAKVQRIGGLHARCVMGCNMAFGKTTDYDLMVLQNCYDEVMEELRAADVIHIHNRWLKQRIFRIWPETLSIVDKKPKVIQFHSPRHQLSEDTPESFDLKCPWLVVAQYQVRLYPEARPVPNVVPIDDCRHTPTVRPDGPPRIFYGPSNTSCKGWDDKGWAETRAALKKLKVPHILSIMTDTPLNRVLEEKRTCDICIDEIKTGSYHLASLEGLSQGLATIAGLDEQTVDALEMITGTRRHPWIVADPRSLHAHLHQLCVSRPYLLAKQRESRAYMERYWDPCRLTRMFKEIYDAL